MLMGRALIPTGIQSFITIRDGGYLFVDKSDLIARVLDAGPAKVHLFTRPRRFGKSLNLSMLDAFLNLKYEGNAWFDDLKISGRKDLDVHSNAYPVIRIDLKEFEASNPKAFFNSAYCEIAELCRGFRYLRSSQKLDDDDVSILRSYIEGTCNWEELKKSLRRLSDMLERHHGRKVVILVDEYDKPVNDARDGETRRATLDFLKVFLSSALKGNDSLAYGVLTGVMQISKESIFSGLNNLRVDNIFDTGNGEMFGFTPDEVKGICETYGHPEKFDEAKEWYDGYRFGSAEVYNPWSILSYVEAGFVPREYWAGTSGNTIISDLLTFTAPGAYDVLKALSSDGSVVRDLDWRISFDDLSEPEAIYSVMAASGYLRAEPEGERYRLSFPNKEVAKAYDRIFSDRIGNAGSVRALAEALASGDESRVKESVEGLLRNDVSFRILDSEHAYQAYLLGLLHYLHEDYDVAAEKPAGRGYCDIIMTRMRPNVPNIVLELKKRGNDRRSLETMAREGPGQIRDRECFRGLRGRTLLYGMAFDGTDAVSVSETLDLRSRVTSANRVQRVVEPPEGFEPPAC